MMKLAFMGAAGTVTGSKYLLSGADSKIMVDCGLFQGLKDLRLKNWAPLEVAPSTIDAVLLTHAHLDHSGYLPLLAKEGFKGPIYCTGATAELCDILLRDSAYLQEKDAEFANRYGFSKHKPARPLYTSEDAEKAIGLLRPQAFDHPMHVQNGIEATFRTAGHILGASTITLQMEGRTIVFSGDLGRMTDPVMPRPVQIDHADYLMVESTYGNRKHEALDVEARLADIISITAARGGSVIVPAFAVGRTQSLLYHISRLKKAGRIPDLPVFLDSPMAINASHIYCENRAVHRLSDAECKTACSVAKYTRKVEESKKLTYLAMPAIIISASGMATGDGFCTISSIMRRTGGIPSCSPGFRRLARAAGPWLKAHVRSRSMAPTFRLMRRWTTLMPCRRTQMPTRSLNGFPASSTRPKQPLSPTANLRRRRHLPPV